MLRMMIHRRIKRMKNVRYDIGLPAFIYPTVKISSTKYDITFTTRDQKYVTEWLSLFDYQWYVNLRYTEKTLVLKEHKLV